MAGNDGMTGKTDPELRMALSNRQKNLSDNPSLRGFQQGLHSSLGVEQEPSPKPDTSTMESGPLTGAQIIHKGKLDAAKDYYSKNGKLPPGVDDDIAALVVPSPSPSPAK